MNNNTDDVSCKIHFVCFYFNQENSRKLHIYFRHHLVVIWDVFEWLEISIEDGSSKRP